MLRRRRLDGDRSGKFHRNIEGIVKVPSLGEHESQEARFKSWKGRPEKVIQEMPPEIFQKLQNQHNLNEDER